MSASKKQNQTAISSPEIFPEQPPDTPQEQKEKEKQGIEHSTDTELANVSLDILETRVEQRKDQKEMIRQIETIQLKESPEKQKESLIALRVVLFGVLQKLFAAGMTKDQVRDLSTVPFDTIGLDATEKAAVMKGRELFGSTTVLGDFFRPLWQKIIESDYVQYVQIRGAKDAIEKGKFEQTKGNKVVDWIKDHPYVSVGIALAGAYGAYKLLTGFFGSSKESNGDGKKEESGFFGKVWHWLLGGTAVVGGVFGIGRLLGSESIQQFFKKQFNIDISNNRISQFIMALSYADVWEAIRVLFLGPEPHFHMYCRVIDDVKKEQNKVMSHTCLRKFGTEKYKDFVNTSSDTQMIDDTTKQAMTQAATAMGIPDAIQKFMMIGDSKKEQQEALKKYLTDHKDKITDENITVDQALGLITDFKEFAPGGAQATPQELGALGTAASAGVDIGQHGLDQLSEFGKRVVNRFREEYGQEMGADMEKLMTNREHWWNYLSTDFVKGFLAICDKHGMTLIIHGGEIFITEGYKTMWVTTSTALSELFLGVVESPSAGNTLGGAGKRYLEAGSLFILIGAGAGALKGKGLLRLTEAAKGAGKGALFPFEFVKFHTKTPVALKDLYNEALFDGKYFLNGKVIEINVETIQGLERMCMEKIFELHNYRISKIGEKTGLKGFLRRQFLRSKAKTDGEMKRWMERFNKLQEVKGSKNLMMNKSPQSTNADELCHSKYSLKNYPDLYEKYQGASGRKTVDTTTNAVVEQYKVGREYTFDDGSRFRITELPDDGDPVGEMISANGKKEKVILKDDQQGEFEFRNSKGALIKKSGGSIVPEMVEGTGIGGYQFKNGDTVEFENGSKFKVSEVQDGTLYGTYEQSTSTGTKTTFNQRLEFTDGKWTMYGEGGNRVAEDMKIKTTTAVGTETVSETAETEGIIEKVEYITKDGKQIARVKVKGNPEWVEMTTDETSSKTMLIKRLKKNLAESGKLSPAELAKVEMMFGTSKLLKYLTVLEKVAGPVTAATILYHLNTAEDKKKALAETGIGLGTFMAGMKLTDWQVGGRITPTSPGKITARAVIDLMGGMAVAMGFTEPITEIVDKYILTFPGAYGASEQVISAVDKVMTIYGIRTAERVAAWSVERVGARVMEKATAEALSKLLAEQAEKTLLKSFAGLAEKGVFKTILRSLGWKGVVVASAAADQEIPVLDVIHDILAAGLLLWSAKDIYDIVIIINNAMKMNEEMKKRTPLPIANIEVKDPRSRATLLKELTPLGKTLQTMYELDTQTLFGVLMSKNIPELEMEITRQGMTGTEVWIMKNGNVVGMKIKDASGEIIAEVKDKDAEKIEKAMTDAEKKEKK